MSMILKEDKNAWRLLIMHPYSIKLIKLKFLSKESWTIWFNFCKENKILFKLNNYVSLLSQIYVKIVKKIKNYLDKSME